MAAAIFGSIKRALVMNKFDVNAGIKFGGAHVYIYLGNFFAKYVRACSEDRSVLYAKKIYLFYFICLFASRASRPGQRSNRVGDER